MKQVFIIKDADDPIILHQDSSIASLDSAIIKQIDSVFLRPIIKKRAINHFASNKSRNITSQHTSARSDKLVELIYQDATYHIQVSKTDPSITVTPTLTAYKSKEVQLISYQPEVTEIEKSSTETPDSTKKETIEEAEGGYQFETGFEPAKEEVVEKETTTTTETIEETLPTKEEGYLFQTEFDESANNPRVGSPNEPQRGGTAKTESTSSTPFSTT